MVALLSELWRFVAYLLRPENSSALAEGETGAGQEASALAGLAKALFWAGLAVLAGFGLAQLGG